MGHDSRGRRLLVWDAPDMDHTLTDVISERASSATRPQMVELYKWFAAQAATDDASEACVFATIPPKHEAGMTAWVVSLRHAGFYVFVRPSTHSRSQATLDMMSHATKRVRQGGVDTVYVATHNAGGAADGLREIAAEGVEVVVMGYRERSPFVDGKGKFDFIDLEDIEGVFTSPLPRTNLFDLHASGQWFEPLSSPEVDRSTNGQDPATVSESKNQPEPTTSDEPETALLDLTALGDEPVPLVEWIDPNEVISYVRRLVFDAAIQEAALPISDVGGELRRGFPGFTVARAGFASVRELLDAVKSRGDIELEVSEDGRHQLVAPQPELASDPTLESGDDIDDFPRLDPAQPDITASFTDATTMSTAT